MKLKKILSIYMLPILINFCLGGVIFFTPIKSLADENWQQTLEQNFDHVETFDELNDWGNGLTGDPNGVVTTNLPQKTVGGQGLIDAWQWDGNGGIQGNAIANHGSSNVFRGTGKSIKLGYDWQGKAPAKIEIFTNDGDANGGYAEAYIFFMVKFPNFLPNDGSGLYWWDALKFFYPTMGFRAPKQFGTDQFAALNVVTNPSAKSSYGLNLAIMNLHGGSHTSGLAGKSDFETHLITAKSDCSQYEAGPFGSSATGLNSGPHSFINGWHFNNNLNPLYFAHDWFGIEFRFKTGTPDIADAELEIWVYDKYGNEVYNGWVKNFVQIRTCQAGGQTWYDDEMNKWNGFSWGENRLKGFSPYATCSGSTLCKDMPLGEKQFADPSVTDHFHYLDDIIIDNQRIGPKYFAIKNIPNPPTNLRVVK